MGFEVIFMQYYGLNAKSERAKKKKEKKKKKKEKKKLNKSLKKDQVGN